MVARCKIKIKTYHILIIIIQKIKSYFHQNLLKKQFSATHLYVHIGFLPRDVHVKF